MRVSVIYLLDLVSLRPPPAPSPQPAPLPEESQGLEHKDRCRSRWSAITGPDGGLFLPTVILI